VFGGKITTYRHLAQNAVDLLARHVPALDGPAWTDREPLPGGDFPMLQAAEQVEKLARAYPFLDREQALRLTRAYGTHAYRMLDDASSPDDLGRDFGHGLRSREVDYLIEHEWARTTEDVLWRRTKLGLRLSAEQREELAGYMTTRMGSA
jgi:glycerol-3-phosphate dehydrogenase